MPIVNVDIPAALTTERVEAVRFTSPDDLLNELGLEGADYDPKNVDPETGLSYVTIGDGAWDERSGGAVAFKTCAGIDSKGRLRHLSVDYLCLQPDGQYESQNLLELSTSIPGSGRLAIKQLSVLENPVTVSNSDAVGRVLAAMKDVHGNVRYKTQFPQIANIFAERQVFRILGIEPDSLPGLSPNGHFNFSVRTDLPDTISTPLALPRDFAHELLGSGVNELGSHHSPTEEIAHVGAGRGASGRFRYNLQFDLGDKGDGALTATITPYPPGRHPKGLSLFDVSLTPDPKDDSRVIVDSLQFYGDDSLSSPQRQRRLGVINASNRQARTGEFPSMPDIMTRYGQNDIIDTWRMTEGLDQHPQMSVIAFGGHGDREYLPGFGGTIGGNSHGIFCNWRDENGRTRRKGVVVDCGETFNKLRGIVTGEHGAFDFSIPDLTNFLDDFDDILLSHLHADHDGLVHLARADVVRGKTCHASEYDCRVVQQKLKQAGIPPERWPAFNPLKGEGWIDVNDGDQRIMSVFYAVNAIPHSTPMTAYAMAPSPYLSKTDGRPIEKKPTDNPHYWSYVTLGDMKFPRYNLPDYDGEKPLNTGFKPDFFTMFKRGMLERFPSMSGKMKKRIEQIDVVEIEATSIHLRGFSDSIVDVHNSWRMMNEIFQDKGLEIRTLSTKKEMHEMLLMLAVETQRNITPDGAYLENRWRDMNVVGVNTDVLPTHPDGGNVQKYLDYCAELIGAASVLHLGRASKKGIANIAETPERTILTTTGTQGSEIEYQSVGTRSADGASRMHRDRKWSKRAYGNNPKDYVVVYGRAIPGNAETQLAQIRREIQNGRMVISAVNNGTYFYNVKEPYYGQIVKKFEAMGRTIDYGKNNELFVHGFCLDSSGHGREEDFRQGFFPWFKENGVQRISVQHFQGFEPVRAAYSLADEFGIGHPPQPIPLGSVWTMAKGKSFEIIAKLAPAFIFGRTNRRADKGYGGTVDYKRAVFRNNELGVVDNGLFAGHSSGIYFQNYGTTNADEPKRAAGSMTRRKPFDRAMTRLADRIGVRRILTTRGPENPLKRPIPAHINSAGVR